MFRRADKAIDRGRDAYRTFCSPGCHAAVHGDGAHNRRPLARYHVGIVEGEEGRSVIGNEHFGVDNVRRLCVGVCSQGATQSIIE